MNKKDDFSIKSQEPKICIDIGLMGNANVGKTCIIRKFVFWD